MRLLFYVVIALSFSCLAAPPAAEQQARSLRLILSQADDAYYNKNESLMSDAAYDALREQYNNLISDWPELAEPKTVGAPVDDVKSIAHNSPALSLQKATSNEAVEDFLEKCSGEQLYCIEPKIDGLTVVLRYSDGLLTRALTRGDGKTGTDITAALLASGAVPARLSTPQTLEVRGEAFLPFAAFEVLNKRRTAAGESALKSPRNSAAGTLRLSDYAKIARRGLQIQLFEVLAANPEPATHSDALALIKAVGLPAIESRIAPATDVLSAVAALNQERSRLPFPTDGVVIRLNDRARFKQLGNTGHHPHGALARKWKETPKETRLLNIEWTRGKSGKLTPVAVFTPVEIDGATIQRASLYNENHLRAMDLKIGDQIRVIRSGGSIPEIIGRAPGARNGTETEIPDPPML